MDLTDTLPSGTIQLSTMDLHRFENGTVNDPATVAEFTSFPRTLVPGGDQIFDDIDHEFRLSTGRNLGDGNQASHFKDDGFTNFTVGIMDPTFDSGTVIDISAADLRVLDLLGWEIASAEADPEIELLADGAPVTGPLVFEAGARIRLNAVATDGDGLGFPVFAWLGNTNLLSHIWDFDGATTANPLVAFKPDPLVTFDLRPGEATSTFDLAVTVWDTLGDTSQASLTVTATEPPEAVVVVDGVVVTGPLSTTSGSTIQFYTVALDEDGLGFPVFAWLGNPSLVSYIWNFDGASAPFPLSAFTPNPPVTFTLDPGEPSRTFNLSVSVWDSLGISTQVPITVNVTQ